ncbi:hypothetical protein [Streptomyces sp. MA5143a]|uniref:hypothetical protein n=1 Tax=Streptomyces sp. MA5143a TaxID=2083010 RepID=UPI0035BEF3F5
MEENRVAQLEKLGMAWSHLDVAWEKELAAPREWAAEAGHLLAPVDATYQGYQAGISLKNARAATRRAATRRAATRRAAGPPGRRERAAACQGPAGSADGRGTAGRAARAAGGHRPVLVPRLTRRLRGPA